MYRSAFLREHFIEPQNLMTIMVVLCGMAIILLPSMFFGKKMKEKIITLWVLVIARAPPNNNGERFYDSFSFNDRDAGSALINVVQFQAFSAFCCFC